MNRGAACSDGKIFYNTLDAHTVAVDAETGEEVWKTRVGNIQIGETMTMAPIAAYIYWFSREKEAEEEPTHPHPDPTSGSQSHEP